MSRVYYLFNNPSLKKKKVRLYQGEEQTYAEI